MERGAHGGIRGVLMAAVTLAASAVAPAPAAAQADGGAEGEVLAVVEGLFEAMRAADSAAVRGAFHPETHLVSVAPNGSIGYTPVEAFVQAVGRAEREWDERIFDPEVRIDGELATVWTEYTFHLGGEFSHCGTDAFTLLEGTEGWRIVAIADTRRSEGCGGAEGGGGP